jgi:hypothetical protein
VADAKDGDTIIIPPGIANWQNTLNYSAAITIQGAGVGQTILKNDAPGTGNNNSSVFNVTTSRGTYTIRDIEFADGDTRTTTLTKGVISLRGTASNVIVRDCTFRIGRNRYIAVYDYVRGVTSNCEFWNLGDANIHVFHQAWAGGTLGDKSWSSAPTYGTTEAWIVEHCTFYGPPNAIGGCMDAEGGGRWVLRYCKLYNTHEAWHGTEGGLDRSTRQFEIYGNEFNTTITFAYVGEARGGSGVYWDNTCTGPWKKFFTLNAYRSAQYYTFWGIADGTNSFDNNQDGGPFESGTATGTNGTGSTLIDSTKMWTANQWVGYTIKNLSTSRLSNAAPISRMQTPSTITEWAAASQDGLLTFAVGDSYEIRRVLDVLDMPGMGQDFGLNRTTKQWPNQVREAIYSWNNTLNGANAKVTNDKFQLITEAPVGITTSGYHFYNNTVKPNYTPLCDPHPFISGTPCP